MTTPLTYTPVPPAHDADRAIRIEMALTDLAHEIAALRSIAVRTETRVCVLAEHVGAGDKLQTKPNLNPNI